MRLNIVILFSMTVHASGLMRLCSENLTRLLALASLPGEELEKEVKRVFFEGQRKMLSNSIGNREFLELRELFSLRQILDRAEEEELPGDVTIIAMLVTDGDAQIKYADSFEWDLVAKHDDEFLKILMREVKTNGIYVSIQRATVASVVDLSCQLHPNAGGIIAHQCMGSQYWDIPGRWRRAFERMLNIEAVKQKIMYMSAYDEELLEIIKRPEFADLLCKYVVHYDFIAQRKAKFMKLLIADEILTHWLYIFTLGCVEGGHQKTFLDIVKKMEESPERILSDLVAEGYWLYSEGCELDEFIRTLPEGHDVFRKLCERYPSEMKGIDRSRLSIEVLKTMMRKGRLDEMVKNLVKRSFRCADVCNLINLRNIEPRARWLFLELFKSGELDEDIKRGLKTSIKDCKGSPYHFIYLWYDFGVHRISKRLFRSGEFDEEVKRLLSMAIKSAKADILEWSRRDLPNSRSLLKALLCTVPKARELAKKLLSAEEFDEITWECNKRSNEGCSVHDLRSAKRICISE